uniref:Peptidase A1 domain-containing protein n=1 Tax=Leersia perrieri TaxID=77586 RepID=A0A0D9VA19_9ORYZ
MPNNHIKRLVPRTIASLVSLVLLLLPCMVATADQQPPYKPLVVPLVRESKTSTSLYTIPIKNDESLVVDLAGSLVWSTCRSTHTTVPCNSATCSTANQQQPRRCRYVDGGSFWTGREPGSHCSCIAHPFNPVTGECSTGDLTTFSMSANSTINGTMQLHPETFTAVGTCAPDRLLASLPASVTGIAGFSNRPLSLPSQLATQRGFGKKFALCMSQFVAFGEMPVYLAMEGRRFVDYRDILPYTPILTNPRRRNDGYYLPVKRISVSWSEPETPASLPAGALAIDARTGLGGVVLSTTTPYTVMRHDVFRAFAEAFDTAIVRRSKYDFSNVTRHPPVGEFKLCYNGAFPMRKRPASMDIPTIHLEMEGATGTWSWYNDNYLVFVPGAICVGVLEMGQDGMPVDGEPAMVVGVKQLDWNLLVFDLEKMVMWFSGDLSFRLAAILSLALLLQCILTTADQPPSKPLILPLVRDTKTSLYTISINKDDSPLVVDLAGTLVWSTCRSTHTTVPCNSATCGTANQQQPRRCRYVDGGSFWTGREPGSHCSCIAHPFNPLTGECSTGDLTTFSMSANSTTNGTKPLYPEEFTAVGTCAPDRLLASLPASATGVAGFSNRPLSLPSQLATQRGFGKKFALCMSQFVVFGEMPVGLGMEGRGFVDYRDTLPYTPILTNPRNPNGGYYLPVEGITVLWHGASAAASLPRVALQIDARTGRGGVVLSTTTPYAAMRHDVFRAFAEAFDAAVEKGRYTTYGDVRRVPAVEPFKLCYGGPFPFLKRPATWDVPAIYLELAGGATGAWPLFNENYMVQTPHGMCVGILEMGQDDDGGGAPVIDGEPAIVLGLKQLDMNLLVFDLDKMLLWFSGELSFRLASCVSPFW